MPATLHIYVPLHFYCSLHIDLTLLHTINVKINELQHIFTIILQSMCMQLICPSNATKMSYVQNTHCASMRRYANICVTACNITLGKLY